MYGFSNISTKLIFAQAVHETGNFTSAVFKENNNLFGMRQAKVRKNFATGTNRAHATFKNHLNSVRDYFERQKNFRIANTDDSRFVETTVNSNYAEDQNYKSKWIATVNSLKSPVDVKRIGLLFFSLIFILILARYLFRRLLNGSNTRTINLRSPKNKKLKFTNN